MEMREILGSTLELKEIEVEGLESVESLEAVPPIDEKENC